MSYRTRYESSETRRAKAVRRELLRPLRRLVDDLPCQIRLSDYDLNKATLVGGAFSAFVVRLDQPLDEMAILDWLDEDLDVQACWLDDRRDRIAAVRFSLEAYKGGAR
jgi:hypothetical protein